MVGSCPALLHPYTETSWQALVSMRKAKIIT